jgi:hypothetical protein
MQETLASAWVTIHKLGEAPLARQAAGRAAMECPQGCPHISRSPSQGTRKPHRSGASLGGPGRI